MHIRSRIIQMRKEKPDKVWKWIICTVTEKLPLHFDSVTGREREAKENFTYFHHVPLIHLIFINKPWLSSFFSGKIVKVSA